MLSPNLVEAIAVAESLGVILFSTVALSQSLASLTCACIAQVIMINIDMNILFFAITTVEYFQGRQISYKVNFSNGNFIDVQACSISEILQ